MIDVSTKMDGALIVATLSGEVSGDDYTNALLPVVEKGIETHGMVKMLIVAGDEFEDFDVDAAWEDIKMGISHWRGFERIAVTTDKTWMRRGIRVASPVFPCPMDVFTMAEQDDALRWLQESLGSIHVTELGDATIRVNLLGEVDASAYENASANLDAKIAESESFKLLLDVTEFTGWQGVSAMGAHLSLVRQHAPIAEKVAIIGNKSWQRFSEKIGSAFLSAEVKYFDEAEEDAAKVWLSE